MAWRRFIPKNAKPSPSLQPPSPDQPALPSTHSSTQEIHSEPLTPSEREKLHSHLLLPLMINSSLNAK